MEILITFWTFLGAGAACSSAQTRLSEGRFSVLTDLVVMPIIFLILGPISILVAMGGIRFQERYPERRQPTRDA